MQPDRPSDHRLTAAERMRLDDLERRLAEDDPALAEVLGGRRRPVAPPPAGLAGWAAGAAAALLVLAAVVGGIGGVAATLLALLATLGIHLVLQRRTAHRRS